MEHPTREKQGFQRQGRRFPQRQPRLHQFQSGMTHNVYTTPFAGRNQNHTRRISLLPWKTGQAPAQRHGRTCLHSHFDSPAGRSQMSSGVHSGRKYKKSYFLPDNKYTLFITGQKVTL